MKKSKCVLLLAVISLFLSACAQKSESRINDDINYLCSETCGGRLPGTSGNVAAQDYILKQYEEAGLGFFLGLDSYLQPYTQTIFDPMSQEQLPTASFPDGTEKKFQAGVDFYPYLRTDGDFSAPVTTDSEDAYISEKVLLAQQRNSFAAASVIPSNMATAHIDPIAPSLHVNSALFEELKGGVYLSLEGNLQTSEASVNNIVGVMKGSSSENAMLITAHFDHVGGYGDIVYPGALDNASGVATMLEVLRQMKASEKRPPFDIVFIAFNGEDMGQKGSAAFVAMESPYKSVNVINIDTVGLTGTNKLAVSVAPPLSDQLVSYLSSKSLNCEPGDFGQSVHGSFLAAGIPAVTLSTYGEETYDVMHRQDDTPLRLDIGLLSQTAEAVCDYILETDLASSDSLEMIAKQAEEAEKIRIEQEKQLWAEAYRRGEALVEELRPARNQVIPFAVSDVVFFVRNESSFATIEELQIAYPGAYIPMKIGDYQLIPTPILNSSEPDLDDVWVRVRRRMDEAYLLKQPQLMTDFDKRTMYHLYYQDNAGKILVLMVTDSSFYTVTDLLN